MYPTIMIRNGFDMNSVLRANTYGKRQRLLREDAGLSQIELTEKVVKLGVKVTQGYLSKLEKSGKMPSARLVAGVAKALNANPAFLLLLSDDPTPRADTEIEDIEVYSQEVAEACDMIEAMDDDTRHLVLEHIRTVYSWDQERRDLHEKIYSMLLHELTSGVPDREIGSVMGRLRDLHGRRPLADRGD